MVCDSGHHFAIRAHELRFEQIDLGHQEWGGTAPPGGKGGTLPPLGGALITMSYRGVNPFVDPEELGASVKQLGLSVNGW